MKLNYSLKVENDIELTVAEGYNTLHTSSSAQTIGTDTKTIYLSGGIIQKSMNGAYDNPTMTIKD